MAGHFGICVVYLVDEAYDVLFYRHLEQIARCSADTPIRLYAGVNRLAPTYVEHLKRLDFVTLCDLAPTELRGSREHAHYLDQLVRIALADGADHVVTLDVDSFPVDPGWLARPKALLDQGAALVGVLRTENGDRAAPHPSFMLFPRAFQERYAPTFDPLLDDPRAQAFRAARNQRLDTGAGYALALHENNLAWGMMKRSNRRNDHPLLGGIYSGLVYHFGGGSRAKVFSVDLTEARRTRPDATLEELWPGIAARNEQIAQSMLSRIAADFDGYIRYLRGQD